MRDGEGPLSLESLSLWQATAEIPSSPDRAADSHVDVCVVGAGIAGMTTAYLCARAGLRVTVLDDGPVAGGQTQRTTAHLTAAIDDRYHEIEKLHGKEGARLAAESHTAAIDRIERIVRRERIDCDFERVDGFLFLGPDQPRSLLDDELAAAHRAGLNGVEPLAQVPVAAALGPCLRFPDQGQFHPLKYLAGVQAAIRRDGSSVCTGAHVRAVRGGTPAAVELDSGVTVTATHVVVATNTPVNDRVVVHTKQAPYLTYVIGVAVPRGAIPHVLCWDTLDPYHYIRVQATANREDVLLIGGEDHKTGQSDRQEQCWRTLERWARERFPMLGDVRYRWSGQIMETIDGLAFIGRNPLDEPNVYIATGDSGMGITHGTIAGMILSDLIQHRDNPWTALYDPSRKTLGAAATFARENLNVVRQYADWLAGGATAESGRSIGRGKGAIVRRGLRRIAAYRDENGTLHEFSAACRHLDCIVAWNDAESTWDCPCHGSRYDRFGHVINGPANSDLAPLVDDDDA